jgi:isocitrate/isopropylmalate dehydrogenase
MAKSYDITVIPGEGTGPEVVAEGIKVLDAVAALEKVKPNFACFDFGGARYLRTGEILPEGAITQGGMGIAAGGNINPQGVSMFEPIGGSAPKYTGKNIINPLAAICAAYMMLKTLGEDNAAARIEKGIVTALQNDIKSLAAGSMGLSTTQVGDKVASYAVM